MRFIGLDGADASLDEIDSMRSVGFGPVWRNDGPLCGEYSVDVETELTTVCLQPVQALSDRMRPQLGIKFLAVMSRSWESLA